MNKNAQRIDISAIRIYDVLCCIFP